MKIATRVSSSGRRDQPALDRERADAGEDVAAILRVGDDRLVDEDLQEQIVDVDARRARDLLTTATLLVSGSAPPMPSIWRGSGEPMTRSRKASRAAVSAGRSSARKIAALGRAAAHPHAADAAQTYFRPMSVELARACRTCRGRARRRPAAGACRLRWPRARCAFSSTVAASARVTTQTPSSSATITSPGSIAGAGADHRHVDRAERRLDRALREDRLRPDREAHLGEVAHVAHAGVDDQPAAAARLRRGGEQIAEIAVLARRLVGASTRMSPSLQLLDRDMDHPVVARRRARS